MEGANSSGPGAGDSTTATGRPYDGVDFTLVGAENNRLEELPAAGGAAVETASNGDLGNSDTRVPGGSRSPYVAPDGAGADVAQLLEQVVAGPDADTAEIDPAPDAGDKTATTDAVITESELQQVVLGQSRALELTHVNSVLNNHALWREIDAMNRQLGGEESVQEQLVVEVVSTTGVGMAAGLVAYALRGGALLTSLMATMPLWRAYDPLPVLALASKRKSEKAGGADPAEQVEERDEVAVLFDH
jgi:hypothetical protein